MATAPVGVFSLLLSPVVGRMLPRVDARLIATMALIGFAGVFFVRTSYLSSLDTFHLVLPTLLQGIPTTLWFVPLTAIILSGLRLEKIPAEAGLSNFFRIFCGAAGTSISTTVWNNRTILDHVRLTKQASVSNPVFNQQISAIQSSANVGFSTAHAMFDLIVTG